MFALRVMQECGLGGLKSEEDYRKLLQVQEKEHERQNALKQPSEKLLNASKQNLKL